MNEETPRTCPGCESTMQRFLAGEVELDRCPFCGGVWFDRGELEAVTQRALEVERLEGHTTRRCAYCRITLATALIGSVPAEVCTACLGTYLDEGELEELAQRELGLERIGARQPAPGELTYRCVGCGDVLPAASARMTARGLSCSSCHTRLGRSELGPEPAPGSDTASRVLEGVDQAFPSGLLWSAMRWFMS